MEGKLAIAGLFRRARHSSLLRRMVVAVTGTAGAQLITLAFAPFVTRIYGPEAFGLHGIFMAFVGVLTPVAAFAYPTAIVLAKDEQDAGVLAALSFSIAAAVSFSSFLIVAVGGKSLAATLELDSVAWVLFLVPLALLFASAVQVAQQYSVRQKRFDVIASAAVASSLLLNLGKVGLGLLYPIASELIALGVFNQVLLTVFLFYGVSRGGRNDASLRSAFSRAAMRRLAVRHRDFPLYRAPQNVVNGVSQNLPLLMLAMLFGPAAAGFYALGRTVMGLPSALVGVAVGDVFYQRFTETSHAGKGVAGQIVQATVALAAVGFLPFGLVVLAGPELFQAIFGESWATSGRYARWLAVFFFFNFVNKPAVAAVPVLGIQRGLLVYELLSTAGKILGLFIGFYWFSSALWAIRLFATIGSLAYVAMILWIVFCAVYRSGDAKAG